MGYYTDYSISIKGKVDEIELAGKFEDITGYNYLGLESVKWYDNEKDMKSISKMYPEVIFQVDGVGEETGDVWRDYYKNGKRHSANTVVEVIHEPFDEAKLK